MDNGKVLNKVDNLQRIFAEDLEYYHIYDSEHGHLLFTEYDVQYDKDRVSKKQLLLIGIEEENPPWWKVWA